ncbi:MAG: class I SAM-dependent methyltransferase [Ignavibacteria bacterium]
MNKDLSLRLAFNEFAYLYDKARPACPEELIEELIKETKLNTDSHLLEIGPGTGQATKSLAKHGFNITAVEIGNNLAEILKAKTKNYPGVNVITGAFEDTELPNEHYHLVYAATSFHWLKPESKFTKPHHILKPAGYLAIIKGQQISDEGDDFFEASQPIYNKYWNSDSENPFRLKKLAEVKSDEIDINLFELTYFNCFPVTISYSADEYCDLLFTDSEKIALPREKRIKFVNEIWRLIYNKFDNKIKRSYANSLTIARKVT